MNSLGGTQKGTKNQQQNINLLDVIADAKQSEKNIFNFGDFKQFLIDCREWINNVDLSEPVSAPMSNKITQEQIFNHTTSIIKINPNDTPYSNDADSSDNFMGQLLVSGPPEPKIKRRKSSQKSNPFEVGQNNFVESEARSSRSFNGYEQINQYELREKLGKGAFSEVFLGIDVESFDKKKYAVKVMESKLLKKKFFRKNSRQIVQGSGLNQGSEFIRSSSNGAEQKSSDFVNNEIAILKKIDHQYITNLSEVIIDKEKGKAYLILQFCPNGFINENKSSGSKGGHLYRKLTEEECKRYYKQLCLAIHYIHSVVQIAHRDIKPENILISSEDTVKLSDFGLGTEATRSTEHSGTRLFMPPESSTARGKKQANTQAADIWALGVTLLILIEGQAPEFKETVIVNLKQKIEKLNNVSEQCRDFLKQCLEDDPEKRPTSEQLLDHKWISGDDPLSMLIEKGLKKHIQFIITKEEKTEAVKERNSKNKKNNVLTL